MLDQWHEEGTNGRSQCGFDRFRYYRRGLGCGNHFERLPDYVKGLVRGPNPPDSFTSFLAHYRLLKLMMQCAKITASEGEYYPRSFEADVKADYDAIRTEVSKIPGRYEGLLSEFALG